MIFPTKFNKPEEPAEQKVLNTLSNLPDADFTTWIVKQLIAIYRKRSILF